MRALEGELDLKATKRVVAILSSVVREPAVGRAVLEALPASAREALAKDCAFDVLVSTSERPPRVYLRGAWHWLDLSPALTTIMCQVVASWNDIPEANVDPQMEEAIVAEVSSAIRRAPTGRASATAHLGNAKPAGRRVLAQIIALRDS